MLYICAAFIAKCEEPKFFDCRWFLVLYPKLESIGYFYIAGEVYQAGQTNISFITTQAVSLQGNSPECFRNFTFK